MGALIFFGIGIVALSGGGVWLWMNRPEYVEWSKALVYGYFPSLAPDYLQEFLRNPQEEDSLFFFTLMKYKTDLLKHQTGRGHAVILPLVLCEQGERYVTEDFKRKVWNSDAPEDCIGLLGGMWAQRFSSLGKCGILIVLWINEQKAKDKSFALQISTGKRVLVVPFQVPKEFRGKNWTIPPPSFFVSSFEQDGQEFLLEDLLLPEEYDTPWQIKLLVDNQPQERSIEIFPERPICHCTFCYLSKGNNEKDVNENDVKQKLQDDIAEQLKVAKEKLDDINAGNAPPRTQNSYSVGLVAQEDKPYYAMIVSALEKWQQEKIWESKDFTGGIVGAQLVKLPENSNTMSMTMSAFPTWGFDVLFFYPPQSKPAYRQFCTFLVQARDDVSQKASIIVRLICNGDNYAYATYSSGNSRLDNLTELLASDHNSFLVQMQINGVTVGDTILLEKPKDGGK